MEFTHFVVQEDDSQRRLDRVARRILEEKNPLQAGSVQSLMRKGLIRLNEKKADISCRTQKGDHICIATFLLSNSAMENSSPETSQTELHKENNQKTPLKLEEIFKNQHILVINKPYGIPSQPSSSSTTDLSTLVQSSTKANGSLSFRPGALHRLDRYTTGLIAFSQSLKGATWFSENIATHAIKKTYLAIIQGNLEQEEEWTDWIEPLAQSPFQTVKVSSDKPQLSSEKGGKPQLAITHAHPLAHGTWHGKEITLAQMDIDTGRKHQIRSQSAFHGHPLLGDSAYGGTTLKSHQFFLHAVRLTLPKDNPLELPETLKAPIPEAFSNFLKLNLINWNGNLII